MRVVLVGGSGFIGRGLRHRLTELGHHVTVLGRGTSEKHTGWEHVQWDAANLGDWTGHLDGADIIVHMTGKRVDCSPTKANVDELISSRVGPVELVGRACRSLDNPPAAWVQLSSLAIFGDAGDQIIDESTTPPTSGIRQQVEVCQRWEAAFHGATADFERTVLVRPAITIGGKDDPASAQLLRLARWGLGGAVAGGTQWVSWIAEPDLFASAATRWLWD